MRLYRSTPVLAAAALLAACASPSPAPPMAVTPLDSASQSLASDIHLAHEGWPAARWWTAYGDPQLDQLIERALSAAPALAEAAARVSAAAASLSSAQAERGLGAGAEAGVNRQRYSANGLFPAPIGGAWFTDQAVQLKFSYDPDWWGKARAHVAAAAGELQARRAEQAQVEQMLAGAIAQSYFAMQAALAHGAVLDAIASTQAEALADRNKRIAAGLLPQAEADQVTQAMAATRQQRHHAEALALREREALRALLGAGGNSMPALLPQPLPKSLAALPERFGTELLTHRADLQAARWRIEAALSRTEAARAAFYPDLSLAATVGLDALSLSRLFQWGSRTAAVGPTLALPLFDSARLKAGLAEAGAARDAAIADYNIRVIHALRDIAQAALDVRDSEGQQFEQQRADQAAADLLRAAQSRVRQGLAGRATELTAREAQLRQQEAALNLSSQRLQAELSLVRALGGGYHDATPVNITSK